MAIVHDVFKLVLGGPVSSQDDWSIGLNLDGYDGATTTDLQAICTQAASSFNTLFWNPGTAPWVTEISSATKLSYAKLYDYDSGLHLVNQVEYLFPTPVAGVGGNIPAYCAAVFSLRTALAGRSGRGRMYLPLTGVNCVNPTLQWGAIQTYADHFAAWLKQFPLGFTSAHATVPGVLSRTAGVITPINNVELDTIPDTQRGRQNKDVATSVFTSNVIP